MVVYILETLLLIVLLSLVSIFFTRNRSMKLKRNIIIIIALATFASYWPNLLSPHAIENTREFVGMFSKGKTFFIQTLRTFTLASFLIASLIPFSKSKNMGNLMIVFAVPVAILNIVFLKSNIQAMMGLQAYNLDSFRVKFFLLQQILVLVMAAYLCFAKTNRVEFKNYKKVLKDVALTLPFIIILSIPAATFQMYFGFVGQQLIDLKLLHRLMLYFTILLPTGLYLFLNKKQYEEKYLAVMLISVSGLIHFYSIYNWPFSWDSIPIHLCNAAMLLMPVSLAFKSKKVFYFTYFFNTIGAIIALIVPNTTGDMFRSSNVHFWYEHITAFYLPILVVAIGVMPRPKFKEFKWAVAVFVVYFITTLGLNAYVSNINPGIDYFFLNSDFLVKKFFLIKPLREGYIFVIFKNFKNMQFFTNFYQAQSAALAFRGNGGLAYVFYPVYQLGIFIGFTLFAVLLWVMYEFSYKVVDGLNDLFYKKRLIKIDNLKLIDNMDGRSLGEPMNKGGVNMLKIKNLSKRYGNSTNKSLDDFSIEVNAGEVFGFLGHNGAGKSTTIKAMVGILPITEGSVEIFGYDIAKQPLEAKMQIGYVPDNHAVYERLTGREYVNYVADLYHVNQTDRQERIDKYLRLFDLEHAIDNQIKTYSHGMKQKVTVIAALIHNPRLWVLDEPLTGLDPTSAFQVKESLRLHADEGNIVFFSSHIIDVVEKICDRIAIIKKGKLVCIKDLKEMRKNGESLEKLYLEIVEADQNVI